jgi:hypothetical protein
MIDTFIGTAIGMVIYVLGIRLMVGIWPWQFDKLRSK